MRSRICSAIWTLKSDMVLRDSSLPLRVNVAPMGNTYWYAYDGDVSGPFFESKSDAAADCDDGETPRPVAGDVIDTDGESGESDDGDEPALDEMGYEEL